MQLSLQHLAYAYPSCVDPVLRDVSATLPWGWTGLVDDNGCGKSTFARIACGRLTPARGTVAPHLFSVYCEQDASAEPDALYDFAAAYDRDAVALRRDLGVEDDWPWRYDTLSCGQQKRLQVACALWQRPDLLVMDEPTNHVDAPTREAITAALARFKGVGLLISHDRALLDALCVQCLFMAEGRLTARPGGYSQGRDQEELERGTALRQRERARREKKRLAGEAQRRREEASRAAGMRSCRNLDPKDHSGKERVKLAVYTGKDGVAGKLSSRMESRLSRVEETLARVKVEKRYDGDLWMRAEPSARKVLYRQPEMTLALGERQLLVPPLSIGNTDHIALTGPNGAGKTTLVSEVARRIDPTARVLVIPQEPTAEQCRDALSRLASLDSRSRGRVLAVAAALNSDPDRLVEGERTSPGEMRKLMLGLGILDEPELIIMDEPSNYLDLHSVEALERLLAAFPGALLLVSHDAALLEATTSVCWEISESSPATSVLTVGWR